MRGTTGNMFRTAGISVAAASLSLLWGVGGCVSYTNVPVPSSAPAFKHANSGSSIKTIVASLDRVFAKHPVRDGEGRYAVNLPAGTTPETANTIVSRLGGGAMVPYEGMDEGVPVYHISRIWLRGRSGKVDVVYPIGDGTDRGVTVWLHGGDRPWYVERLQYWAPGTVPTPRVYVPIDGDTELPAAVDEGADATEAPAEARVEDGAEEPVERAKPTEPEDDGALYREVDG